MSDKRRRRRRLSGGGGGSSGDEEEDEASITASDHEYESAAEDSALEDSEVEAENEQPAPPPPPPAKTSHTNEDKDVVIDDDAGVLDLSDKAEEEEEEEYFEEEEAAALSTEERGAGDGQEEKDAPKVDDDEDRRNPQYIPKKGMFYEHDDRIDSADEAEKDKEEKDAGGAGEKPRRVPRSETIEKWGHDKFLEREQQPKTRDELVSTYGYDIRNEDCAPRARRRRRYGRGPNKYTRNWEDEKAYEQPKTSGGGRHPTEAVVRGGGPGSRGGRVKPKAPLRVDDDEQFPALVESDESNGAKQQPPKSTRGGGVGRGGGSSLSRGRGGGGGGGKPVPQSEYSANQRLQKEPRPVEQQQHNSKPKPEKAMMEAANKLDKLEISKNKISEDTRKIAKNSPSSNRRNVEDGDDQVKHRQQQLSKRYSNSRQQTRTGNNQRPPQDYYNADHINGSVNNAVSTAAANANPTSFVNANFPTNASGPPPAAPFLPAGVAATPTSASGFLDPAAMVNYGPPPPVQFTPVAVPVTVTLPLVSVPGAAAGGGPPHDTLPVLAGPPLPTATPADQVLLAAAAAASQGGYAEVRGGVTYFNPTAQLVAPVMARPVSKRPKAPITIVDPASQVKSTMSPQSSTDDADEHSYNNAAIETNNTLMTTVQTAEANT